MPCGPIKRVMTSAFTPSVYQRRLVREETSVAEKTASRFRISQSSMGMDTAAYLARIGYTGPLQPSAESLRLLQRAHLLSVPFENLDIGRKRKIMVDRERSVAKVVSEKRGGFCYELNGAFATLLESLGFKVTL